MVDRGASGKGAGVAAKIGRAIADLVGGPNLELQFESGETSLSVRHFSVVERLNAPFEVRIEARSPRPDVPLESLLGTGAGLILHGLALRVWTGIVRSIELVHAEPAQIARSTYQLVIVPDLWLMSQRRGHRIYQHLSTPDILEKLLGEWQLQFELAVDRAAYPKHEYKVQYAETDLEFVSRLCEEAGITYRFSVKQDGQKKKSLCVFTDTPAESKPRSGAPLRYVDTPNEASQQLFVTKVRLGNRVRPGQVSLRDYDFRRPGHLLAGRSEEGPPAPEANYEHFHYLPGHSLIEVESVNDPQPVGDDKSRARHNDDETRARAQRWLEALRRDKRLVELESNAFDIGPGTVFSFAGHPSTVLESEPNLLCVEAGVSGIATGEWSLTLSAVFAAEPYRPPLEATRPHIEGPQSAVVVGPSGQEIHVDEEGRVRVHMHWDREGVFDDNSTCWLRVSQQWAGPGWGAMLIPRIGHEVLVEFLDGNPDQPIIIGRLYSAVAPAPYLLPKHKTRSTWKSDTTPHVDGAFSEIMFEDEKGKEVVFVQAQKDMRRLVKRHETERTGHDRIEIVGDRRVTVVSETDSVSVGKQRIIRIAEPKDLKIGAMGQPEVTDKDTWVELVDDKITITTGKSTLVLEGPDITLNADGGILLHADSDLILQGGKVFLNAQPGKVASPDANRLVQDKVMRPGGRVLASVLKLFGDKPNPEVYGHEGFGVVPLAASIAEACASLGGVHYDPKLGALVPNDPERVAAAVDSLRHAIAERIGPLPSDPADPTDWTNGAASVDQLHEDAKATEPLLKEMIGKAATAAGGRPSFGPGDAFAVKSYDSLKEKVEKRGKPLGAISDSVRGTIITDNPEQLQQAAKALQAEVAKQGGKIVFDNKFAGENPAGYGAVHGDMFLPSPSGRMVRSEVQLHLAPINDGTSHSPKEAAHVLQERTRNKSTPPEQTKPLNQAGQAVFLTGLRDI